MRSGYLILAVAALVLLNLHLCTRLQLEKEGHYVAMAALNDELSFSRNREGHLEAQKQALAISRVKQLEVMGEMSGTIARLRETVQKQKNALAAVSVDVTTKVVYKTDTVEVILKDDELPVYHTSFADEWKEGSVTMGADGMEMDLSVFNKFDFTIREEKRLFKPNQYTVFARNLNPHTTTEDMDGMVVVKTKKTIAIGPSIGFGFGGSGGTTIFVGVGATYPLINF